VRGLLDTSVVVASGVEDLPDESAISVATLAELHFGVHIASTPEARAERLRRLAEIESTFDAIPIDDAVARSYGLLAFRIAAQGGRPRTRVMDILIAATSLTYDLPLYTRDSDFDALPDYVNVRRV